MNKQRRLLILLCSGIGLSAVFFRVRLCPSGVPSTHNISKNTIMGVDCIALTKKYFEVWNSHDVAGIKALHAATSSLADWDASHGPTNEDVSKGIGGIWTAVPDIKIEIIDVYTVRRI